MLNVAPLSLFRSEQLRLAKLLRILSYNGLIEQGKRVHCAAITSGFGTDRIISNDLIDMYSKCGCMAHASAVFDRMPQRNVVSWTSLMCGHLNQENPTMTIHLLSKMGLYNVKPNEFTLSTSFKACGLLGISRNGMQIHSIGVKTGYDFYLVVGNSLLDMYLKCGKIEDAAKVFTIMPTKNHITWNTMISGYGSKEDYWEKSLILFMDMQNEGEVPDEFTFTSMLKACSCNAAIREGRQIHSALITRGYPVSNEAVILGAIVDLYVKCGHLSRARKLFDQIENKSVTSWTSLILGYAQDGYLLQTMELFRQLRENDDIPLDGFVLSGLIGVFADLAFLEQGKQMHGFTIKIPSGSHISVANSIADMYLKCGLVQEAERLFFREMAVRNRVSYTVMITGYGKHGLGKEAILLFEKLVLDGFRPDEITYLAILSACSHSGLVAECEKYFSKLRTDCSSVSCRVEHYACMVDLLGRVGRLNDAKNLIESIPDKADIGIWQTLLSACRVHGNLKMGKQVGESLMSLDGCNPVNYVLLSNLYAKAGCWKECEETRRMGKNTSGVHKEAGQSWVEINKEIHFFYGGDDIHPLMGEIHGVLKKMENRLKEELGYEHELSYALHDVEEESKEENLRHHSEKLAAGLTLVCDGGEEGDGKKVIRIFKNLRVCGDCHEFFKGLSKIVTKVFVVRDATRFHRFEDGLCSCKDFW